MSLRLRVNVVLRACDARTQSHNTLNNNSHTLPYSVFINYIIILTKTVQCAFHFHKLLTKTVQRAFQFPHNSISQSTAYETKSNYQSIEFEL